VDYDFNSLRNNKQLFPAWIFLQEVKFWMYAV
jgi:hypothetical protein